MTQDLMTLIRDADPAADANGGNYDARDRAILASATRSPSRPSARRRRVAVTAAALIATAAIALLGLGRSHGPGRDFDAAARVYRALAPPSGIYHFMSISRFSQPRVAIDAGITPPFALPYFYDAERQPGAGKYQYEEDWVTLDGTRIKWVKFKTRHLVPIAPIGAASFTQSAGRSQAPTDPASSFRRAFRRGDVHSLGEVRYRGHAAWRFAAATRKQNEEWVVDRTTWLPLRYRYVRGRGPQRTTLDIRFLKFEVLPRTKANRLFALTPRERRVEVR